MKINFKKLLSLVIAITIFSTIFSYNNVLANDYDNHWAKNDIDTLIQAGYISQNNNGDVYPDNPMQRGAFVSLLNKVCNFTKQTDSNFKDVFPESPYYNDFLIAKEAGYITGDSEGMANPYGSIIRAEVAVILARIYNLDIINSDISKYDPNDVPKWAMGAVVALDKQGLMKGNEDGTFAGNKDMTNAECYSIAVRILNNGIKKSLPTAIPTPVPTIYTHVPPTNISLVENKDIKINVNGKEVLSDVLSKYENNKIWVSAQSMASSMLLVFYELKDGYGFVMKDEYTMMTAKYGEQKVLVNDKTIFTDAPFKEGIRSYIPLDTLMFAFNAKFIWDNDKKIANIEMDSPAPDPRDAEEGEITTVGYSRAGSYKIPFSESNAIVTVWRKSGAMWYIAPKPVYSDKEKAFLGSVGFLSEGGSTPIKVRIEGMSGIVEFKTNIKTENLKEKTHEDVIPNAKDLLLRTTFNNISVYIDSPENYINVVKYRQESQSEWKYAYRLQYDDTGKQFRGSIVGLKDNTTYEVYVKFVDNQGNLIKEYSNKITTWAEDVKIAKTIDLKDIYTPGKPLAIQNLEGSPDGYIRILGDGKTVIDVTDEFFEAVSVAESEYVIIENLIVRGGYKHGIYVMSNCEYVRILNCDISGWGRAGTFNPKEGLYKDHLNKSINNEAAIYIGDVGKLVIEKCYFHDPKGRSNSWGGPEWKDIHPQGPNGIYGRGSEGVVVRYNDFVGSDEHRWNDSFETYQNFGKIGGVGWDADVYGNYQVFGQDDSTELDGTQMNVRYYGNKVEGFLCGVSTAGNTVGPSYVYRNLIINLGDEMRKVGSAMKNGHADPNISIGYTFFFHNTMIPGGTGINQTGTYYRPFSRNNIIETNSKSGNAATSTTDVEGISLDYDLHYGNVMGPNGSEDNGVKGKATFISDFNADFRLGKDSLGIDKGEIIPNFSDGYKGTAPDMGAIELDEDVLMPNRPINLRADKYQLNLVGTQSDYVTIKVGSVPEGTTFNILKNDVFDWFSVESSEGTSSMALKPNSEIKIKVTGNPENIGTDYQGQKFTRGNGAFLIKLSNGFSLPVTVYLTK